MLGLSVGSAVADRSYIHNVRISFPVRATPNINGLPHELYRSKKLSTEFSNWLDLFQEHYNSKEIQELCEHLVPYWL